MQNKNCEKNKVNGENYNKLGQGIISKKLN